jgi:hypothetical protein
MMKAQERSFSRRGVLLNAVISSVAEHGYDRSSLRDIAARAGMSAKIDRPEHLRPKSYRSAWGKELLSGHLIDLGLRGLTPLTKAFLSRRIRL